MHVCGLEMNKMFEGSAKDVYRAFPKANLPKDASFREEGFAYDVIAVQDVSYFCRWYLLAILFRNR